MQLVKGNTAEYLVQGALTLAWPQWPNG